MADLAPASLPLTHTSPSATATPPTLASLAAHIADALPTALERSLKLEVENSIMCDRCAELRMRADILQRTIRLERDRQASLRGQIAKLKGPQAPVDKDGGVRELRAALGPRDTNSETPTGESTVDTSLVSDGSPVSLRSKRKGRIFPDDMRIVKRMKLE